MTTTQEASSKMDGNVGREFHGSLRQATASDADLLAELGRQSFYEAFCEMTAPEDMAAYLQSAFSKADIKDQIKDERSIFLIADVDDMEAGYAYAYPTAAPDCIRDTAAIQLVKLYLRKKDYGRAVGDALMQTVIDRSRYDGYQSIWLSSKVLRPGSRRCINADRYRPITFRRLSIDLVEFVGVKPPCKCVL